MADYNIRVIKITDKIEIEKILVKHWGSAKVVTRGSVYNADKLPGFVAVSDSRIIGLITYNIAGADCEVVTLNSLRENRGIGSALIGRVKQKATESGCHRLWLITTNDNLSAIRFYQKRGFRIAAIHIRAIEKSRRLKPEIPPFGNDGIPIRDEIEMEIAV